jgi:prepilin-type N-terminal cleavage/methylation domain-containing protein
MKRARGFSLVELMVGVALSGLVVAGAFEMHLSFNRQSQRQQQVAELQQTLRVAMQLIERAIRTAGQGLPSSHAIRALVGSGCTPVAYWGFQYSNDNTYRDPKTTFSDPAVADTDPDWFRVVAADDAGETGATYAGCNGAEVQLLSARAQRWQPGDLFLVVPDGSQPPSTCALACARPYQVTGAAPGMVEIQHGERSCYDPAPGLDGCLGGNGRPHGCAGPGATLRHFSGGGTVYRIMTAADQGDPSGLVSPKLTMRTAPFGTPFDDAAYQWTPLADGIEDMQLAVLLADGTVCDAVDDPSACNFANAAAVRVTLVGRSSSPLQGDYLRRSATATVQLRNYAP